MEKTKYTNQEREIIKKVVEDMKGCGLFIGRYDATNGSPVFMHGVSTVMEYLAYLVSDSYGEQFSDEFLNNLIKSEKSA
jgi:hypothetical protein